MEAYQINDKDIEAVIRHLKVEDPKNADREYAIQLLKLMNRFAKELVDKNIEFAELLAMAVRKQPGGPRWQEPKKV